MGRDEWFRRTTWSPQDEREFQTRLRRSRTDFHKAQYLRLQAAHLHQADLPAAALALLEQLRRDYPVRTEMASAYELTALIYAALDDVPRAVQNFRLTLQTEAEFPNVRTGCELYFAKFVVLRRLAEQYDEVLEMLARYAAEGELIFPLQRYLVAAARALIAHERGDAEAAQRFAAEARAAALEKHSGFRYHPEVGLVGGEPSPLAARLAEITVRD